MVCLGPHPFKFFKGYLPQNLLSTLLNTLCQMQLWAGKFKKRKIKGVEKLRLNWFLALESYNPQHGKCISLQIIRGLFSLVS